jgi:hypothetical protein
MSFSGDKNHIQIIAPWLQDLCSLLEIAKKTEKYSVLLYLQYNNTHLNVNFVPCTVSHLKILILMVYGTSIIRETIECVSLEF